MTSGVDTDGATSAEVDTTELRRLADYIIHGFQFRPSPDLYAVADELDAARERDARVRDELAEWELSVEKDGSPSMAPVQGMATLLRRALDGVR